MGAAAGVSVSAVVGACVSAFVVVSAVVGVAVY